MLSPLPNQVTIPPCSQQYFLHLNLQYFQQYNQVVDRRIHHLLSRLQNRASILLRNQADSLHHNLPKHQLVLLLLTRLLHQLFNLRVFLLLSQRTLHHQYQQYLRRYNRAVSQSAYHLVSRQSNQPDSLRVNHPRSHQFIPHNNHLHNPLLLQPKHHHLSPLISQRVNPVVNHPILHPDSPLVHQHVNQPAIRRVIHPHNLPVNQHYHHWVFQQWYLPVNLQSYPVVDLRLCLILIQTTVQQLVSSLKLIINAITVRRTAIK